MEEDLIASLTKRNFDCNKLKPHKFQTVKQHKTHVILKITWGTFNLLYRIVLYCTLFYFVIRRQTYTICVLPKIL